MFGRVRARAVSGAWMLLVAAACSNAGEHKGEPTWTSSRGRVEALRARFVAKPTERSEPVLARGVVDGFVVLEHHALAPVVGDAERRRVRATARVELPEHANGEVVVGDDRSTVAVRFVLEGARAAHIEIADGIALYRGALDGADVLHRPTGEGTEDYVVFEEKPAREVLDYRLDVSRVAGLRLVSDTLELLDDGGTPRLRVAPPYVVDSRGTRTFATLAVEGCAYDASPAPPWGRRVTAPGASTCSLRVAWSGVAYPVLVDPAWTATASMSTIRYDHTATLLGSGRVLVAGGSYASPVSAAELYDPASGTFAATGPLNAPRVYHTASMLASGKVLFAGGTGTGTGLVSIAELYDPTAGTFTKTVTMAKPRWRHRATTLSSGKILFTGGQGGTTSESAAETYDPGTGAFTATASMSTGRYWHTATALGTGKVLVVGGRSGTTGLSSVELYDPVAGTFAATGALSAPQERHSATVLASGKVLIAGRKPTELYDPVAATFSTTVAMVSEREFHTETTLPSGKILFAAGGIGSAFSTAEIFDPLGVSVATAQMNAARLYHTATLLPDGRVFVAGGTADRSTELFGQLATGIACGGSGDCVSGFCVDGYCCGSTCASMCQACNVAGSLGTCTNATGKPVGTRTCGGYVCSGTSASCPTSCSSDAACAAGYFCDGSACIAKRANGATCPTGARECSSGRCVDGYCCNSACTQQCEACDVTGALGTCTAVVGGPHTGHTACGGATGCVTPQCDGVMRASCAGTAFVGAGTPCGAATCDGTRLVSQQCDGAGTCKGSPAATECAPFLCASGACTTSCTSDDGCASDAFCSGGVCKKKQANGKACGAASECASGFCIDGVCCNSVCAGQCEACDASGAEGTCAAVAGVPHGKRAACPSGGAENPCKAALCDGLARTSCDAFVGSSVSCRTAKCDGKQLVPGASCDGKGVCPAATPVDCGAFACDAVAGQCKTSCASDADCASGGRCSNERCVSGATCADDHTSRAADGTTSDCTPYRCETSGTCAKSCSKTSDCASGAVCDTSTQQCAPAAGDSGSEGGCAASARVPTGSSAFALFVVACAARLRRRR